MFKITGKEFVDIYNRVTGKNVETEETVEAETEEVVAVQPKIDVLIDEQIIIADDAVDEENNV